MLNRGPLNGSQLFMGVQIHFPDLLPLARPQSPPGSLHTVPPVLCLARALPSFPCGGYHPLPPMPCAPRGGRWTPLCMGLSASLGCVLSCTLSTPVDRFNLCFVDTAGLWCRVWRRVEMQGLPLQAPGSPDLQAWDSCSNPPCHSHPRAPSHRCFLGILG